MFYCFAKGCLKAIGRQCIRETIIGKHYLNHPGGYILAVTHISHLEPFIVSTHLRKRVFWIVRREFFANRFATIFLNAFDAIPVNRIGVPVAAMRRSISLLSDDKIVGIFPEGAVATGSASVVRRGTIKKGAAFLSCRTGKPIIPTIVLGTQKLNTVAQWLPFRRASVQIAYGAPIFPPTGLLQRRARAVLTDTLIDAFVEIYHQLLDTANLSDADVP